MLFTIGVNELVFVSESGTDTIELAELVKRPDFSQLPKEQQPISNPELQLTGLYFMQEASRPVRMSKRIWSIWRKSSLQICTRRNTWFRLNCWKDRSRIWKSSKRRNTVSRF